jgi:orotate phosphoribosyltransferase-like protein
MFTDGAGLPATVKEPGMGGSSEVGRNGLQTVIVGGVTLDDLRPIMTSGHFEVVPGIHVSEAVLCDILARQVALLQRATHHIIDEFLKRGGEIDVLVGLPHCSAAMAEFGAAYLYTRYEKTEARAVFLRRPVRGDREWRSTGRKLERDEKCLILAEHAVNGVGLGEVAEYVGSTGAEPVAFGVILDRRRKGGPIAGVPVYACLPFRRGVNAAQEECELCRKREELQKHAHVI